MRGVSTCKASSESIIPHNKRKHWVCIGSADSGMWRPPHVGADAGGRGICLWQVGARRDGQLTIALTIARHCARHPDKQALHRQPPQGLSRRTASCTKFLPRLRNGARGNRSGLTSFRGDSRALCRAGCRGLGHSCPFSRLRGDAPDASADKQALDSGAASCTTPSRSRGLRAATQITVWPDYCVDDRDHSSFGQF